MGMASTFYCVNYNNLVPDKQKKRKLTRIDL